LFLFGNNDNGQLGHSISDQYAGPLEVSLPDPVTAVACGHQHTVVLTKRGRVYVCGMLSSLVGINNTLFIGQGDRGQLGLGSKILIAEHFEIIENLPKYPTAIAAGEAHTAVLGPQGDLYVFGDAKHGKLSYETHSNEFEPYSINKFKQYNVLKVVCGGCQTIILAQKKSTEDEDSINLFSIFILKQILSRFFFRYNRFKL
jgi:alpha-tubulin suppressor-like RCC1 family protein